MGVSKHPFARFLFLFSSCLSHTNAMLRYRFIIVFFAVLRCFPKGKANKTLTRSEESNSISAVINELRQRRPVVFVPVLNGREAG